MRIPYVSNPPEDLSKEDQEILDRVKARRGEKGLIPLDLALLHAPKIADGWNSMLGAVRTRTSLSDAIREIAICRVALINGAWFEWIHHLPLLETSTSFQSDPSKLETIKQIHPTSQGSLDNQEWVVLRYADAMTRSVEVGQDLFGEFKNSGFSEQEIVEITATVAAYNMVSRFLVALDVGEMNSKKPQDIKD